MKNVCRIFFVFYIWILGGCSLYGQNSIHFSVQKIWDNGAYNSFTSLVQFKGKFYCSFREGEGHVFDDNGKAEGRIRILFSKNGRSWKSVTLLKEEGIDLRDPKLSITPDGRLMVSCGGSVYQNRELTAQYPFVCFSQNGTHFSKLQKAKLENSTDHRNDWIWRLTWQGDTAYGVNYFQKNDGSHGLWLMSTTDGISYQKRSELLVPDFPNESTIRFLSNGQMAMMVRRDGGDNFGYWGLSMAPFTNWTWKKMEFRLGGQDFLVLDNNNVVACSRSHYIPSTCKTVLFKGNALTGKFQEVFVLPSGGDTSYPGLLVVGKKLWVSYYSCHETKRPAIYLAKIPLSLFK